MKDKLKSPAFQYTFCVLSFLSAMFFIKLKVPFTNSGEITFYPVELLGLALGAFLIFYLIKNFKKLRKEHKIIFWAAFISQLVFILIYAGRVFISGLEMKSILILESNLFVLAFLFLIVLRLISAKTVVTAMSIFFASLSVISVFLIFFAPATYVDCTLFYCDLFYVLTFGNAIRTYLVLICLPITLMFYINSPSKLSLSCLIAQTAGLTVCGMISGARVNYLCIPLLVAFTIAAVLFFRRKQGVKAAISVAGTFVLAIVFVFFISQFSARVYSQMMRLDMTQSVMETLQIKFSGFDISAATDAEMAELGIDLEDMLEQAEGSAAQSSSSRDYMWAHAIEDIKKAPLFGEGLKLYDFKFASGTVLTMQAHNFILEYMLAFGLVGFVFWTAMILTPEVLMLKKIKFRFWKSTHFIFAICSMFLACMGAFFQPYFVYPNIMFFIFLMMGCYYSTLEQDADAKEKALASAKKEEDVNDGPEKQK